VERFGFDGAWIFKPQIHQDPRGSFLEWFRGDDFVARTGHHLGLAQANCSVSRRGVLRGVHYADVPPGQAKYVTCVHGEVLDVVVDLRTGSPTFGRWATAPLNGTTRHAVYVAEGLGHAFMALSEEAVVIYLCSAPYNPGREHGVHPLDPGIGIAWPEDIEPLLSPKDAAAPTLAKAEKEGMLPAYEACLDYYERLQRLSDDRR
jgi:dTDP-4-dehydrorhamnose 3,5-epimerase